jgi:hypothetical protein
VKRIRLGTVTLAVTAILFGLLTAYVAHHYFGASSQVPLRADQSLPGTAAENVPTLAPPQSTATLATGHQFRQGRRGQVIYVQVEAEQTGQAEK